MFHHRILLFLLSITGIMTLVGVSFYMFAHAEHVGGLLDAQSVGENSVKWRKNAFPISATRVVPSVVETPVGRMLAVGDIMLGRYVETLMRRSGDAYPFEGVADYLQGFDNVFGNLEGPILDDAAQTPNFSTVFAFKPFVASLLKNNNVTMVSLANNHTFDFGEEGYLQTKRILRRQTITPIGNPRSVDEGSLGTLQYGNRSVRVIAVQDVSSRINQDDLLSAIMAQDQNDAYIMVAIHWGDEYEQVANQHQVSLAHAMVDAGADVVIGHHPHVVQNIEEYHGQLIFYSLGNFIFDQYFSAETQEGLAVAIDFFDEEEHFSLVPMISTLSQPRKMDDVRAKEWLKSLAETSSETLRTKIEHGLIVIR